MGEKNKEAAEFWNKAAIEEQEVLENKREEFWRNVAQREEGISADREKMQMGITTTPKENPSKDEK